MIRGVKFWDGREFYYTQTNNPTEKARPDTPPDVWHGNGVPQFYSKIWFNTLRQAALAKLAAAQIKQRLQEVGIKPDGIINFLSNEPPFQYNPTLKILRSSAPRRLIPSGVQTAKPL
jgi:hypothetical protein